jgi:hypothetical protein
VREDQQSQGYVELPIKKAQFPLGRSRCSVFELTGRRESIHPSSFAYTEVLDHALASPDRQ